MKQEETDKQTATSKNQNQEEGSKQKRHFRFSRLFLACVLVGLLFCGVVGYLSWHGGFGKAEEVTVEIPSGSSTRQIGQLLEDNGVVFNGDLFSLYVKASKVNDIRAGQYDLTTGSGFPQVVSDLDNNYSESGNRIIVPEGTDIMGVSQIIANKTGESQEDVLSQINDPDLFNQLVQKYPDLLGDVANNNDVRYKLEGYLYPATYTFNPDQDSIADLVDQMVAGTDQVRQEESDALSSSNYNFHQILTLASIIEREASKPEDRRMVAGVFYNRLEAGMPLQSDISINYANEQHESYITVEDTQTDSPYNLYQNSGLGPGPYNSPSRDAIDAALHPTPSNYYYFVADLKTGDVYYSETYEEHQEKVDQYVSEEDASYASSSEDHEADQASSETSASKGSDQSQEDNTTSQKSDNQGDE